MRKRKINGYTLTLLLLAIAYILVEWYRPKPIDWSPTYINTDKIPYGTYALFQLLDETFPGQKVNTVRRPAYNLLRDRAVQGNYILINPQFDIDKYDLEALQDFVKKGNNVFIAAAVYDEAFADSLNFKTKSGIQASDSLVQFSNPRLGSEKYKYEGEPLATWFSEADSSKTVKIGEGVSGNVNFIRIRYGKGNFYLHSQPRMFTNYHLLKNEGHQYIFRALSCLPPGPIWWDEYYKQGREGSNSVFGVITRYRSIRWAWYLLLGGSLLFIIFRGKRRQRVIPFIPPLKNTSLEFAGVVSSLYYNQQDFKDIALKKIRYFREYIRNRYQEPAGGPDEHFEESLAAKSGFDKKELQELFRSISHAEAANSLGEAELHRINKQIEDFYTKTR